MSDNVKYKGSFSNVPAGYAHYVVLRIKFQNSYVDLTTGTQTVKLYALNNSTDAITEKVFEVVGTFPVTGYTGDGYVQLKFLAADTTGKQGEDYYYKLIWNNGTEDLLISKSDDILKIV